MVNKALAIAKALYPSYSLLILFDNTTSYFVYADNALHTRNMNKVSDGKQPLLQNKWFEKDKI